VATLRDSSNIVVIFADPKGEAYVNGRPVGVGGGVAPSGDILFVPQELEYRIHGLMREPVAVAPVQTPARTPVPASPQTPVSAGASARGRVVIDPGHGGEDPGTLIGRGAAEKKLNLAIATQLADILRSRGVEVIMTRSGDTFPTLEERADIANRRKANLFVSIHADSSANRSAQGATIYVSRSASKASRAAAKAIANSVSPVSTGSRGVREANYRVLVRSSCPAVLVETGFLSNARESARLNDEDYQRRMAEAIADGIVAFLNR
jgi:N-acetylmuramoyl-L-alanine amidase